MGASDMQTWPLMGRVQKSVHAACQEWQRVGRAPVVVEGPEPPHEWIVGILAFVFSGFGGVR